MRWHVIDNTRFIFFIKFCYVLIGFSYVNVLCMITLVKWWIKLGMYSLLRCKELQNMQKCILET